ncbi:MAG: cyclic nucleotide-binding domain-containing protein [Alphaproteobacteria bacterium]|nr:cyclic nucleotide-binding domain-containing protein [Alphaproteobacteria bacterium]
MALNEEVEALRAIPLFQRIEASKLRLLAFTSERVRFEPGDLVVREGDIGDAAYIVLEGRAEVLVETPQGPLKVADLGRNDIIGEIAILIDVPRTATVRTVEAMTALRISKELFFRLVEEFPQMAVEIMRELAQRLDKTTADLREARAQLAAG